MIDVPQRLPLANLPTPLESVPALSHEGLSLWVKRDDLTGCGLSGNKVRKLEFHAAQAQERGADVLVTCGAVTSNHARATAMVAARLGIKSHLMLRGTDGPPTGNLLLNRLLGAEITFITPEQWPERTHLLGNLAMDLQARGHKPYVIPEGGSNAIGSWGYLIAVQEMLTQAIQLGIEVKRIVHATGSGGTTAGLALGVAACGRDDIDVIGVAVCETRAYFDEVVARIVQEGVDQSLWPEDIAKRARWTIWDTYKGRGYARSTSKEMDAHAAVARTTGLIVDPVYTGKALQGLLNEAKDGALAEGVTVFLHTGGIFGWFSFGQQVQALTVRDATSVRDATARDTAPPAS